MRRPFIMLLMMLAASTVMGELRLNEAQSSNLATFRD